MKYFRKTVFAFVRKSNPYFTSIFLRLFPDRS